MEGKPMKTLRFFCPIMIWIILISGCNYSVNKSVTVNDGEIVEGGKNVVNGHISIGSDAEVNGSCRSVNGFIRVGDRSKVEKLQVVNGDIDIGKDVTVRGSVETVNGTITCEPGVEIYGKVKTVNGSVKIRGTDIQNDIHIYNGNIDVIEKSIIRGSIIVKKSKGGTRRRRRMTIEITDESVVEGDIIVEDKNIDAKVILSQKWNVKGAIKGAEVVVGNRE
jgi:predicted acyltransferase (DUF342 family)